MKTAANEIFAGRYFVLGLIATSAWVSAAFGQAQDVTFVTRLGLDTLAAERITLTPSRMEADVLVRTPRTVLMRYEMSTDEGGDMKRLESTSVNPLSGTLLRHMIYERAGDSVSISSLRGDEWTVRTIAAPPGALPFIDMVHWPFELQLRKMRRRNMTSWEAPMISRDRIIGFPLALVGNDSATVTHPTRGTMRVLLSSEGGIQTLDAGATTRAVIVTRGGDVDVRALAGAFAGRDVSGRGMGALSGRDTTLATVKGARLMAEFGTPRKRGRDIWGGLLRYGKLWRTGANRATHFKTDKALRFGKVVVQPGEYTLFSIPEAKGGTLIINGQTGQNGQQYDKARDVARVVLHRRPLTGTVEVFRIRIDEMMGKGHIRLQWDNAEYVAEFEVVD